MKKFILSLIVILSVLLSIISVNATQYFTDTDMHWAEEHIEKLRRIGALQGSENKAYTERNITRGEFAAILGRTLYNIDTDTYNVYFDDVDKELIFAPYISMLFENEIIYGIGNNIFSPDSNITREQIAIILTRIGISDKSPTKINFNDIPKGYKYRKEVLLCASNNIINGYSDNTFRPKNNSTRAEAFTMIARAIEAINEDTDHKIITEFSETFFISLMTDKTFAMKNSIGQAKRDIDFINEIMTSVPAVSKKYTDHKIVSIESKGKLKTVTISYKVYFSDIYYNASKTINMISKKDVNLVYDINTDYRTNKKINLTWEVSSTPPSYSPQALTHISPAFFEISSTKTGGVTVNTGIDGLNLYDKTNKAVINYAGDNNYNIWAMYKTDFTTDTANKFLNNPDAREKVLIHIAKQCIENKINGINFDFENMYMKDRDIFSVHVHEFELIMHEIGITVSVDVTKYEKTSEQWSLCYNRDRLGEYADYIFLMAYDQYYAGSKKAGPVSGLNWAENAVKETLAEIPAEKLVLGMPFYTRYWETMSGNVVSTKAISMETAIKLIKENNAELIYIDKDKQHKAIWYKDNKECSFWFETAETIGKRVDLANKYDLAGVASWRRGFETADVWIEINKKLNKM